MRTAEEVAAKIWEASRSRAGDAIVLEEWRREILTEAAERAVQWVDDAAEISMVASDADRLRRAVMGEEVEG